MRRLLTKHCADGIVMSKQFFCVLICLNGPFATTRSEIMEFSVKYRYWSRGHAAAFQPLFSMRNERMATFPQNWSLIRRQVTENQISIIA